MEYEKKYLLPFRGNDFVLIIWERGFKNIRLMYGDRLLFSIPNLATLKNGVQFTDPELGKLKLLPSKKPIALNLLVDDIHSSSNNLHPFRNLKGLTSVLWTIMALNLATFLFWVIMVMINYEVFPPVSLIMVLIAAFYGICAYFNSKLKAWPALTSFIVFCVFTALYGLFTLASIVAGDIGGVFMMIGLLAIRGVIIFIMAPFLKHSFALNKHKESQHADTNLIDQF